MARGRPEIPKSQQKKVARQLLERQKRAGVYESGLEGLGKGFLAGSAYPADVAEMIAKPGLTPSASYKAATMRPRGGGIEKVPPPVQDPKLKGTYPYFAKKMGIEPDSAESIAGSFFSLDPMAKAHAVAMGTKLVAGKLAGLGMGAAMFGGLKKVDDAAAVAKPIFTSPGGAAAADIAKETIPANKVKSQLEGRGVNKEEMEWTGFNEWIKTKKGEVSKVELEEFFQQNQIEVREVVRGGKGSLTETQMEEIATNEVFHDITTGYRTKIVENILEKQGKLMPGGTNDPAVIAAFNASGGRDARGRPIANLPWEDLSSQQKQGYATRYRIDNDLPGTPENAFDDAAWEYDNLIRAWSDSSITEAEMNQLNQLMKEADAPDIESLYGNTLAEIESGEYSLEHLNIDGADLQTKFSDKNWQLPGGENYRELVLMVPPKKVPYTKENVVPITADEYAKIEGAELTDESRSILEKSYIFKTPKGVTTQPKKIMDSYPGAVHVSKEAALQKVIDFQPDPKPRYTGGHFEENDVVAHIRFNERVDPDGNKVLFIEEIQSDWAHKGQSEGFQAEKIIVTKNDVDVKFVEPTVPEGQDPNNYPGYYEYFKKSTGERFARGGGRQSKESAVEEAVESLQITYDRIPVKVPEGPFVTDTHQWTNLALKRMIRWGSDNGFDSIGWVTGKQSADRYKVSKQISEIHYSGSDFTALDHSGNAVIQQTGLHPDDLPELIGKEPARKLMEQPKDSVYGSRQVRTLSGLDLDIGGEYHKLIYDQVLTAQAKKIGKKHGAKVEQKAPFDPEYNIEKNKYGEWVAVFEQSGNKHILVAKTREEAIAEADADIIGNVWTMRLTDKLKNAAKDGMPYYVALPPLVIGAAAAQRTDAQRQQSKSDAQAIMAN